MAALVPSLGSPAQCPTGGQRREYMNFYLLDGTEYILFGKLSVLGILQLDRAQEHESLSKVTKKLLRRVQQRL